MVLLGATLTLPGIAGIVFTIGMAVDSNVLIYERIREEAHLGRSVISALDAGFKRAFATIVDFERDDVRGGADPLSLRLGRGARLCGLARPRHHHLDRHRGDDDAHDDRAVVPARPAEQAADMNALAHRPDIASMKLLRLAPENTKFGFMRFRRVSYPLSATLSIISVLMFLFVGMNFGIDFAGGTQVDLRAKSGEAHIAELRAEGGEPRPRPGRGAADRRGVRTCSCGSTCSPAATPASRRRSPSCARPFPTTTNSAASMRSGRRVSAELVQSGTLGVVVAILAVLTYLWFRFEWQFAVGAIIGTMHDLLLTVGFFCVTQLEFNQTSIAAILTIVGYSLNETVVVLDRIREVMRKYKRLSTAEIVDMSVNAVLPRTIMTATTVFLALLALFFLGGHVIRSFSAAMIWGIFVATYSSIFICSPMLIYHGRARRCVRQGRRTQDADAPRCGRKGQGVNAAAPARGVRARQPSDRGPWRRRLRLRRHVASRLDPGDAERRPAASRRRASRISTSGRWRRCSPN